jgi:hypothetical protein
MHPADAADDARWLTITSWQGGGEVVDRLERTGAGAYRTTKPIPVSGPNWKTTLRLHRGREVLGLAVYMPADPAIPAKEIPASARFTRTFQQDKELLQREQKSGVPGWLTLAAYLAVLAIGLAVVGLIAWGLRRVGEEVEAPPPPPKKAPVKRRPPVPVPH